MEFGVIIEKGPKDWQIIQQKNGSADLSLSGSWRLKENLSGEALVYIRVLREDSGDSIVTWTECMHIHGGNWSTVIKDIPAGGLYRIETCLAFSGSNWSLEWGLRGDMIHHIGVGDLYVIAGQSNSSGYGKDPIFDPPELGVHIFRNSGKWDLASHPLSDSTGSIHNVNTELVNAGTSPYMKFAKMLKRDIGYPVGLVQTALGGSALSAWNPDEDGCLYRNMLDIIKLCGGRVKGVLWYQGCSDADAGVHETYLQRFKSFVSNVRKDLSAQELPFLTVQLNRSIGPGDDIKNTAWGTVREAQRQAARVIENVYVVPSVDCSLSDDIHNSSASNIMLGERLAKLALAEIYAKKYLCRAPDISSAILTGEKSICLLFNNVYGRLSTFGMCIDEMPFTVADEEGKAGILNCVVEGRNRMLLELNRKLIGRVFVHGAYEQNPKCFLPHDIEGHLPILAFYRVLVEKSEQQS